MSEIRPEDVQIVIPMSGEGTRFKKAGYEKIKPLIEIDGRPIIDYVASLFEGARDFLFLCRDEHVRTTDVLSVLERIKSEGRVKVVEGAKKGPVYAVSQAFDEIDDSLPVLVSYCDFNQIWDFSDFVRYVNENQCDGAIPCYKGFHPHLLHEENFYASCRVDASNKVFEIREKYSFTENKQDSPQSSGIYYFKSGRLMKKYFTHLMEAGEALNGEYYASLVYLKMIEDGLDIRVYDKLTHFCQWGTPQDFEEFCYWKNVFSERDESTALGGGLSLQKLVPMAGAGSRFVKEGYSLPKPLIEVKGKPMVVSAALDLPIAEKNIFIYQSEHVSESALSQSIEAFIPGSEFIEINELTEGQACTCLLARDSLDLDKPLIIGACDNGMIYCREAFDQVCETADAVVFTFKRNPTVVHKPNQYGWVDTFEDDKIKRVSVKQAISSDPINDHAVVGAFWFKKASIFIEAAERMISAARRINGEFYVDELINDVVQMGCVAKVFEIESYICWGTPDDLRTYEYWGEYFKSVT